MTDLVELDFDLPEEAPPSAPPSPPIEPETASALATVSSRFDISAATDVGALIQKLADNPAISVDRAEQLFTFLQRVRAEDAKRAYFEAMIACQEEMTPVRRAAENKQTHSRYATYDALDAATRPIYNAHGFVVTFDTEESPLLDHIRVVCIITHLAGHERRHSVDMACDGKGPKGADVMTKSHAVGSAISYGKRYSFGNGFNIVTYKDDDGNAASARRNDYHDDDRNGHDVRPLRGCITPAQVATLEKLARETGTTAEAFCKYAEVPSLAHLRADLFDTARQRLLQRKRTAAARSEVRQ